MTWKKNALAALVTTVAVAFLGWLAFEVVTQKADQAALKATVEATKGDINELKTTVNMLKETLDIARTDQATLKETVKNIKDDIDELKRELAGLTRFSQKPSSQ